MLDARGAAGPLEFSLYNELNGPAFARALEVLPNVEALFLDGHADMDCGFLSTIQPNPYGRRLLMLSLNNCTTLVGQALVASRNLQEVVYLDISGTSMLIPPSLHKVKLPGLHILKLRRKGINDLLLRALGLILNRRLWSLDLSDNELTDRAIPALLMLLNERVTLRTCRHAITEGELEGWLDPEDEYLYTVRESHQSALFLPGDRYLVDAPAFSTSSNSEDDSMYLTRSDGSVPVRSDTAEGVSRLLSRVGSVAPAGHLPGSSGITHLHLSGNQFSATGLERLLRGANGQIEHFDCDSMRLYPPALDVPRLLASRLSVSTSVKMYGFSGLSQIFRPLWCSNLRSLRIHHSLVTNIPTVKIPGYRALECTYLAEKQICIGFDWAYPLAFLPDMNPRLHSLTLTCVPRHSYGPLVNKLTFFFRLLSLQEQALSIMNKAGASGPGRPLRVVSGIRYLALEMEPREMGSPLGLDAQQLMASGETPFSFFDPPGEQRPKLPRVIDAWLHVPLSPATPIQAVEYDATGADNPACRVNEKRDLRKDKWVLHSKIPPICPPAVVWAGNLWSRNPIVANYRFLVLEIGLHAGAGPVTIHQTRAGAPEECIIFHTTWLFAALQNKLKLPATLPSPRYEDVAAELRRRFVSTREDFERAQQSSPDRPCFYWGGDFEIIDTTPNHNG